jgi:protein-arginine kinase activator protein McsA
MKKNEICSICRKRKAVKVGIVEIVKKNEYMEITLGYVCEKCAKKHKEDPSPLALTKLNPV